MRAMKVLGFLLVVSTFLPISAKAQWGRRYYPQVRVYGGYYPPVYPIYPYGPFYARPGYARGTSSGATGGIKFDLSGIPKADREAVENSCVIFPDKNGKRACWGSVKSFNSHPPKLAPGTYDLTIDLPGQRVISMAIEVRPKAVASIPLRMEQAQKVVPQLQGAAPPPVRLPYQRPNTGKAPQFVQQ